MDQLTFSRRLRGRMTVVRPGILDAELRARRTRVTTRLVFTDEVTFHEEGSIELGAGNILRFRSLERGTLEQAGTGGARHGTSVLRVESGEGRYEGAKGRITSNFVLSPDGAVDDEQVAVIFIDREEE
ncbi:MAG: hypothetical protein H0U00_09560 [Actinobacteria bacterium]|nr:hypothetical protein [Actinomycetota bacterium]